MTDKVSVSRKTVVIIGALGKDFHTFNMTFKTNDEFRVLAFTVAGEQNIGTIGTTGQAGLKYPPALAGPLYPDGIPLIAETKLEEFVKTHKVDEVVFSYSDVPHTEVMHKASRALAAGADFKLITPVTNQIQSTLPVLAVCAVRTGCGKSQVSRFACRFFKEKGYRVVAIREPMPYGDLVKQKCMRFATYDDMKKFECTIEEREEYEPYVEQGLVIYSGVDYETIIREAEKEADIIVWDGGNNEVSFYKTDCLMVVADPLRPGAENQYHPGEVNVRMADVFIVNKMNAVKNAADAVSVCKNLVSMNPSAQVIKTNSDVTCSEEHIKLIKGKRCVVVEDGPTTTHGNMAFGAGMAAVQRYEGKVVEPPKSALVGCMKAVFEDFPHVKDIIPAMGYNEEQRTDLMNTINNIDCDVIVNGSPLDLERLLPGLKKPVARVFYDIADYKETGNPTMDELLGKFEQDYLVKSKKARTH